MKRTVLLMVMLTSGVLMSNEDGMDYSSNYDGGADCGGSNECHNYGGGTWGPSDNGCHDAVVGSPGANGGCRMISMVVYYDPGANGPDRSYA